LAIFNDSINRESLLKERISKVDLLALTNSDQLFLILKLYFFFFAKQPILMRRSTILSLPHQLVSPGIIIFASRAAAKILNAFLA
jgi:hypothetical protein